MHVLYVTCRPEDAPALAEALVDERLVACASIVSSAQSVYRWEGRAVREGEAILLMETADDRVDAAIARIAALHAYEVPKIVAFACTRVNTPYEQWVIDETKPD